MGAKSLLGSIGIGGSGGTETKQNTTNQQSAVSGSGLSQTGTVKGNQSGQGSVAATINYHPSFTKGKGPKKPLAIDGTSGTPHSTGNPGSNIDASVHVVNSDPAAAIAALGTVNNISLASLGALHDVSIKTLENNQYAANLAASLANQSLTSAGEAESRVIEIAGQAAPVSPGNLEQNTQTNYNTVIIATAVIGAVVGIAALYLNSRH